MISNNFPKWCPNACVFVPMCCKWLNTVLCTHTPLAHTYTHMHVHTPFRRCVVEIPNHTFITKWSFRLWIFEKFDYLAHFLFFHWYFPIVFIYYFNKVKRTKIQQWNLKLTHRCPDTMLSEKQWAGSRPLCHLGLCVQALGSIAQALLLRLSPLT